MSDLAGRLLRLAHSRIGWRILGGFALITLLALLVALISLANVATVNRLLDESTRRDRQQAADVLRLELAIERASDGVRGYLLSGDEAYLDGLARGGALFAQAADDLEATVADPENSRRLAELRYQEARFRGLADQQIGLYRQGYTQAAVYLWGTTGRERQAELTAAIADYAAWQEGLVERQLNAVRAQSTLATGVALGLVALAGLISTVIALLLTRSITRPIRQLAGVAGRLQEGDLDVAVPTLGNDEIGTLAQTMERMANSLTASHRFLEASLAETEQRNRELLALNRVAAATAGSLERQELLATTLDTLLELTGVEYGAVMLPDADGRLPIVLARGFTEEFLGSLPAETLEELMQRVYTSGQVAVMDDESGEPADLIALLRGHGMRSAIVVPLASQRQTVGLLALVSRRGRHFEARDVALLRSIGSQIGIAVEHAELLAQRERRITNLSVINGVGRAISAVLELDALYNVIHDQCSRTLDMPTFTIALWDDEDARLLPVLTYLDGQRIDSVQQWRDSPPTLITVIARERRPLLTNDYHATVRSYGLLPPSYVSDLRRSWMGVPMTIGDRLVGVMVCATPDTTYSAEDRDLLAAIANQAAVAVENARLYAQTRELGVIEERNRLAREIHDTIAQGLTGLVLQLEATATLLETRPERARQRLSKATELARSTLAEARRSVWNLRPAPLEERSLPEAIAAAAGRLVEHGLTVECRTEGEATPLLPEVENGVYRVAQEALENIRKHAGAGAVAVELAWTADELVLTVRDDGRGFDPERLNQARTDGGGFGLLGMRERARLIGGALQIESAPGQGTVLRVRVPLNARDGLPRPTQPASPDAPRALIP